MGAPMFFYVHKNWVFINTISMNKNVKVVLISLGAGLFVGFVNGFLGAGGGMLLVPILTILLKLESRVAHSTAVFIIAPISLISGITYAIKGVIDWQILIPVAIGTAIGGIVGTFLLKNLKNDIINIIFWCVMIFSGVWILITG